MAEFYKGQRVVPKFEHTYPNSARSTNSKKGVIEGRVVLTVETVKVSRDETVNLCFKQMPGYVYDSGCFEEYALKLPSTSIRTIAS